MKDARSVVSTPAVHELTPDSRSRLRYRGAPLEMFKGWGATVSRVFSLYWRILPAMKRRELHTYIRAANMLRELAEDETFTMLKGLSGLFFKYQELLSVNWRDYCHLHLLRDYKVAGPVSELKAEVIQWTQSRPVHKLGGSENLFLSQFRLGVREFLAKAPLRLDHYTPLTDEQFVSDPMYWATSGSSDAMRLQLEIDGKIGYAKKTKWATAMAVSKEKLLAMLRSYKLQRNHVIQKRELGKVRPVVASDFETNLKMSRVGYWLEAALAGHPHSTLFMSAKQQVKLWQDMVQQAQEHMLIKMPVDQGHFDHSVNVDMIQIMNEELELFIMLNCHTWDRGELLECMDRVKFAVSGGETVIEDEIVEYLSGICSGWRFTALYDTLANAGELHAVRYFVKNKTGYDPVVGDTWVCQGDDIRLLTISYGAAVAIWSLYTEAGFDVNAAKFFISDSVDEFLRQVTRPGWIAGYPARMASLVFRNPVTTELVRGEERIREMLTTWNQVFNRFGYTSLGKHWKLAIADIASSNHITQDMLTRYLATPAAVGGAGLFTQFGLLSNEYWVSISKGQFTTNWAVVKTPPLAQALSLVTGVPPLEYQKLWTPNVQGPRNKTKLIYTGATLQQRVANWDWMRVPYSTHSKGVPLYPLFVGLTSPSHKDVLVNKATREDKYDEVYPLLDPQSRSVLETLKFRATRKVRTKWLLGRLPFNTPVRAGWSSLATSTYYDSLARYAWANCFNYTRITYSLVISAALGCEYTLNRIEGLQVVRVGG